MNAHGINHNYVMEEILENDIYWNLWTFVGIIRVFIFYFFLCRTSWFHGWHANKNKEYIYWTSMMFILVMTLKYTLKNWQFNIVLLDEWKYMRSLVEGHFVWINFLFIYIYIHMCYNISKVISAFKSISCNKYYMRKTPNFTF
jgi:hypothetical protein